MKLIRGLLILALIAVLPLPADAWTRSPATTFATLPPGSSGPEGLTVDAQGNVYVATFGFTASGSLTGPGQVFVFDHSGRLLRQLSVVGSSPHLLGLAFHPQTEALLVIDFGAQQVLTVNPVTGTSTVFAHVPFSNPLHLPNITMAGLNALTFDAAGNVYISDSFQGAIWKTGPSGGLPTLWSADLTLSTTGVPGFGANGVAFNNRGTALFVANTGNDTVVKIAVKPDGNADAPQVFVNSINGADGLIIDAADNIWVCANQADEIVVVNPSGRMIAKLGDFGGIDPHGAAIGLLFPASLAFGGEFLYVTNLALDLRLFGAPTVDSQWAAQVTRYTVSKIRARIPSIPGLPEPED